MAENTPVQGQSKGKSIACMVTGIASIVASYGYGVGLICAIVSLILGAQCKKDGVQNQFTKVGKITGIIGHTGSGKSTLVQHLQRIKKIIFKEE